MRRIVTTLCLLAGLCVVAATPSHAQSLLFDYLGFDYEFPNPNPTAFGEAGSGYTALGTVPNLFSPLVSNTATNEYTFVMSGFTPTSVQTFGTFSIVNYSAGTITIYEDPLAGGTLADYGASAPAGPPPASFTDGSAILVGTITNLQFQFDTSSNSGSFEAVFNVTGGSQLGNFPLNQRKGWTFSGASSNALNIPSGYIHQVDGQTFLDAPSAVRRTSWGRLKQEYR